MQGTLTSTSWRAARALVVPRRVVRRALTECASGGSGAGRREGFGPEGPAPGRPRGMRAGLCMTCMHRPALIAATQRPRRTSGAGAPGHALVIADEPRHAPRPRRRWLALPPDRHQTDGRAE